MQTLKHLHDGLTRLMCIVVAFFLTLNAGPDGRAAETPKPGLAEWIDERVDQHLAEQGQRLEVVDDATFLRRVYLDLAGRIPVVSELRDFEADNDPAKRVRVVDELLGDERFEIHTARVWRRVMMPPGTNQNRALTDQLDTWLQEQIRNNVGYDQIARRLVTAGGADLENVERIKEEVEKLKEEQAQNRFIFNQNLDSSPTSFLQHSGGQPANMASSVSRVFLGVRLECAQCHDHPFTDWTQQDFWGVAAFFAGARLTPITINAEAETPEERMQVSAPTDTRTTSISDGDGKSYDVSLPWSHGDVTIPTEELPRQYFARWMTSSENPHFAATAVNRVWQQLCGQGLTDSVDDLDQADVEDREMLLDDLATKFADGGYNMQELVRAICASKYYQRSSATQEEEGPSPRPLKVMTPEQVFDSYERAVAMPISSMDNGPRFNGEMEALVSRLEEALGERPDDFRSGIPQALSLMNGKTTTDAVDLKRSKTLRAVVDAPFLDMNEKVDTLFMATLSRTPSTSERKRLMNFINDRPSEQEKAEAFSEVMWALINSEEFVLVR